MARQQAAVVEVGQLGLRGLDIELITAEALRHIAEVLPAPLTAILEWDEARSVFTVEAANLGGEEVPRRYFDDVQIPGGSSSLPGFTVLAREMVRSDDLGNDDRFDLVAPAYDAPAGAALVAPIGWGARPWGVLGTWTDGPRHWSDDDAHFVQSMANTIGLARQRRLAEHEREGAVARLELALQAGGLGIFDWSARESEVAVDAETAVIAGRPAERIVFSEQDILDLVHPEDLDLLEGRIEAAVRGDGHLHARIRIRNDDLVEFRWCEIWGQVVDRGMRSLGGDDDATADQGVRIIGVVDDITDRIRSEARLESLLIAEQSARRSAERARERAALLAEASQRFAGSLDPDRVLESLTDFAVPEFADGTFTLLGRRETGVAPTSIRMDPPEHETVVEELLRRRGGTGWSMGYVEVLTDAPGDNGVVIEEIDDQVHARIAADGDQLDLLRRLDIRSFIQVPLRARGETVGVVVFLQTGRSGRQFDEDDRLFAEQLADRAGLARDNARLYASRNQALRSLQDALLPPALPRIDGLEITARYEVAVDDLDVGGDFYDVLESGTHGHGLVIGDVVGRGPDAAAITGLVRHSIRAAAVRDPEPGAILELTNAALLGQIGTAEFCTAALVRIARDDTESVRLTAASAGHPRPILLRADGTVEILDCPGTLLGVVDTPDIGEVSTLLHPGDAVILHTDGITEARRGEEFFGEDRLIDAITAQKGRTAEGIADGLLTAVNEFTAQAGDDRALLIARVSERGSVG